MKKLNILQVFIITFTLTTTIISCSDDKDTDDMGPQLQEGIMKRGSQDKGAFILNSIDKIIEDSAKNNFRDLELNNKTLDHYKDVLGLPKEALNVEEAKLVVSEVRNITKNGIDDFLKLSKFSLYTNKKIKQVFSGKSIGGFEKEAGFSKLPPKEQDLLLTVQSILQEGSNRTDKQQSRSCTINDSPAPCGVVGAIIGGVVGSAVCGAPCAIGGAIIGGIIGVANKR